MLADAVASPSEIRWVLSLLFGPPGFNGRVRVFTSDGSYLSEFESIGTSVEDLGFDSVWVMEHVFNTGYIKERLQDRHYYHPLATLTYMAATTKKLQLGTSVLVLPYHNAFQLAKFAATLDQMSNGRLVLGVGVGALQVEFEALGIPMRGRGAWTNDCIRMMKELWTNPMPSYHSRRWNFSGSYFSPKPVQKPHVPLWVTERSSTHFAGRVKEIPRPGEIGIPGNQSQLDELIIVENFQSEQSDGLGVTTPRPHFIVTYNRKRGSSCCRKGCLRRVSDPRPHRPGPLGSRGGRNRLGRIL